MLASSDPPRPGPAAERAIPPAFRLPASRGAPVPDGLGAVNDSGVRSRGLTLATPRGAALAVPADGVVRFRARSST